MRKIIKQTVLVKLKEPGFRFDVIVVLSLS
jgi:hypothetical protein